MTLLKVINESASSNTWTAIIHSPTSNSFISVNRKLSAQTHVMLYGRIGIEYILELITEDGLNILTEDGKTLTLD